MKGFGTPSRVLTLVLFLLVFGIMASSLPEFGRQIGEVSKYYLQNSLSETGALSTVGAVVWSYRGYDTLGEVTVLLTAVTGVILMLKEEI